MGIYIGKVVKANDVDGGGRIKVRIDSLTSDMTKSDEELDWCFPILPKFLNIKPKKGECVFILCEDDNTKTFSQRYYIGPLISQEQCLFYDDYMFGGTRMLNRGNKNARLKSLRNNSEALGAFAENNEIGVYGRKNCDIIMSSDDIRIRCGCRLMNENDPQKTVFNRNNPSYIKLKYHNIPISNNGSKTSATIVADEINLIPNSGDVSRREFKLTNNKEQITDEEMKNIVKNAHNLPYGDVLVDFLQMFLQMFKSHTHRYSQLPPVNDADAQKLYMKYGQGSVGQTLDNNSMKKISATVQAEDTSESFKGLAAKLLSQHVRIN